jgi:hypothetical protein
VFEYESISAIGGSILLSKNACEVYETVVTASPFTLKVNDSDDGTALVELNDVIRIKYWNGTEVIDIWGTCGAPSSSGGVTTVSVTLESGGTGKTIQKGAAVVNYGPSGAGVMQLQAGETTSRLRIATHAGSPWTTETNQVVLGNLRNTYGAGANDRYGAGIGDYSSGEYLSYNAAGTGKLVLAAAGGKITLDATSGFQARTGSDVTVKIDTDGDAFFGSNIAAAATTAFAVFANAQTYNSESMGAGDVLFGDNSASKANLLWDKSAAELLFRAGQTSNVKIDTSGNLVIRDNIILGGATAGLQFRGTTGDIRYLAWYYFDDPDYRAVGDTFGDYGGSGDAIQWVRSWRQTGDPWPNSAVILSAIDNIASTNARVHVSSDGNIYIYGDVWAKDDLAGDGELTTDGDLRVGDGTGGRDIFLDGAAAEHRTLVYETAGSDRWHVRANNTAESGSEAGSDFEVVSRNDDGTYKAVPFKIFRSSGDVKIGAASDIYTDDWTDYSGTSTIVGWSSRTTTQLYYKTIGQTVIVLFNLSGTSNSAATSFTLPHATVDVAVSNVIVVRDNGTWQAGNLGVAVSANTCNIRVGYGTGGASWTASGTKTVKGYFIYQTS